MASAYESEAAGQELSAQLAALMQGWKANNQPLMLACQSALPEEASLREKLCRMAA